MSSAARPVGIGTTRPAGSTCGHEVVGDIVMRASSTDARLQRAGLYSGVLFVLLQLAAFVYFALAIFPGFAAIDAPAAERAAAIVKLGDTLRVGNYLLIVPSPFFLFFLGSLAGTLRQLMPDARTLRTTALVAGTAMAFIWPLGAIVSDIELDLAKSGGDVLTVSALDAIAPYTLAL